jgi:hypothetical protein
LLAYPLLAPLLTRLQPSNLQKLNLWFSCFSSCYNFPLLRLRALPGQYLVGSTSYLLSMARLPVAERSVRIRNSFFALTRRVGLR